MGLPLRNSTSFISPNPGAPSLGGPSTTSDSDIDPDLSEPLSYHYHTRCRRTNRPSRLHPHPASRHNLKAGSEPSPHSRSNPNHNNTTNNHHRRLHRHRLRQAHHTHHAKPRSPWAADADEGRALARSAIQLPGERSSSSNGGGRGGGRSSSRSRSTRSSSSSGGGGRGEDGDGSSSASSAAGRRPPSLERQDAFRDEKTAKRRRQRQQREWEDEQEDDGGGLRDEQAEVAELYRMGLLYDDEHERGEGFSLDGIVRDEPVYSLRVRPAKRARREERAADGLSLSAVDLAFSAFGADEAWAGWLLSGSGSGSASSDTPALEEPRPWMETAHDTPRLTVVYELVDDAVSAMSADDDFLDSISVSEISFCGGEDRDEMAWAMLDGDGNALSATMDVVEANEEVDPWVVLGRDGS
ncbi:uncharacterized protein B0H64DRAFT_394562 [Chaetomium fimeti]|uniref:Uncharacterized protein n=1 Tax=Chaetomium fimeti TaxID=1854472 RepID=A0AAE0LS19_9PEZI|nr:hypothetical protein B0H64DRAFT_394562 [Chaetomium fimeti]